MYTGVSTHCNEDTAFTRLKLVGYIFCTLKLQFVRAEWTIKSLGRTIELLCSARLLRSSGVNANWKLVGLMESLVASTAKTIGLTV